MLYEYIIAGPHFFRVVAAETERRAIFFGFASLYYSVCLRRDGFLSFAVFPAVSY